MRKRIATWLALLVGLAAAAPASAKTFVYVHDPSYGGSPQGPRIFGFELARTGELTPLPGSPVPVPGNAGGAFGGFSQTLDYSRKLKRLVAGGGSGVSVFDVGKDGALTLVPGSPFGGGPFGATALVEVGKRQFVYTGQIEGGADQLRGFEFLVGGGLAELGSSPFPGFPSPSGMRDRGHLLFVANADPGSISPLLVGPDGSLTAAQDPVPFEGVSNVAPDPKGKFLYEPSGFAPDLFGFRIDTRTGALAPLAEDAMASGLLEEVGSLAVGKKLVIAVDSELEQPGGLSVLRRARDGSLEVLGDEPSSGIHVCCPALDAAGRRLVTAGKQGVRVFAVRKDGSLQVLDDEPPVSREPSSVAARRRRANPRIPGIRNPACPEPARSPLGTEPPLRSRGTEAVRVMLADRPACDGAPCRTQRRLELREGRLLWAGDDGRLSDLHPGLRLYSIEQSPARVSGPPATGAGR